MKKIRMGVSACLMGEKVRYDGQHKLDRYITDTLSKWIEFVPVCPEFELGLGVPLSSPVDARHSHVLTCPLWQLASMLQATGIPQRLGSARELHRL